MPQLMFQTLYFEDLAVGMRETLRKTVANEDVIGFAEISGDHNPIHLSEHFARKTRFGGRIVHGLYTASLISAVIGMRLPGPGAVYISQTLNFLGPVKIGDVLDVSVEVAELTAKGRRVRLRCECRVGDAVVLDGEGVLSVPPSPKPEGSSCLTLPGRGGYLPRGAGTGRASLNDWQDGMTNGFVLATDPMRPPPGLEGAVYAIGNFDGLHLGHRAVIERAVALAKERARPSAILTFEPHPADHFAQRPVVFRLTPLEIKASLCASLGLSGLVVIPFNGGLAGQERRRVRRRGPRRAPRRLGSGDRLGFPFRKGPLRFAGVSCTRLASGTASTSRSSPRSKRRPEIRRRVLDRDSPGAGAGRCRRRGAGTWAPLRVSGRVVAGQRLGRTLGVPTANIVARADQSPRARRLCGDARVDGQAYHGVASFGVRPTVDNGAPLLEVHLLDFNGDIYGREMAVEFVERIRDEQKFGSLDGTQGRNGAGQAAGQSDSRRPAGERIWRFAANPLIRTPAVPTEPEFGPIS